NTALVNHESEPVDGIIGADILKKGRAVIDYGKNYLYLK
ncbi:MAG: acid protease, partial [Flavobacteriaceae bacterium]|nr:acid protease [Flavobacteriaceae bacterium]